MAAPHSDIFETLMNHLSTMPPPLPVAWPDVQFKPSGAYLRPFIIPAPSVQATLGDAGSNRHMGIFQISLFYPEGRGMSEPLRVAGLLGTRFKRGVDIVGANVVVTIDGPPYPSAPLTEPGWVNIPFNIPYRADSDNS